MEKLICCLFFVFIYTSSQGQDKKDWRGFVEINFGVSGSVLTYKYSVNSPYLKAPLSQEGMPSLIFKAGAVFRNRHFLAVGVENMQMNTGFFYEREDSGDYWGSGTSRNAPYGGIGFYYDYAIIHFKRFKMLAGIQTSLAFEEPRKISQDTTFGSSSSSNPILGVYNAASYQEIRTQQKDVIFVYGVGISCSFDIIKEKLMFGVGAKFIHAPYSVVKSYRIIYQYNSEPALDFYTSNGLMNVNFDLRLKYVF